MILGNYIGCNIRRLLKAITVMDVKEKIKFFAEKLDEMTQRRYRESLRPLSIYELDV